MTDTKGSIRARKLGNTGITEDILRRIADAKGGHVLAIVELKADEVHEKVDGDDRRVDFLIDTIEPVVDGDLDGLFVDHVRDIQAALYRNRKLNEEGEELPLSDQDGPTPSVNDVLTQGKGLLADLPDDDVAEPDGPNDEAEPATPDDPAYDPHLYLDGGPTEDCATCGQPYEAAVHTDQTGDEA